MRIEEQVLGQILQAARDNERIRAVLLTGSRADPHATKDILQDFDITYVVDEIGTFRKDNEWIDQFGERLILQMPDEMTIGKPHDVSFHYLMLFKDHIRIDLTLLPLKKLSAQFITECPCKILLDKDHLLDESTAGALKNYHTIRPTGREFNDACNEFWWVATNVAKGLWREEITYAKYMMEVPVRSMFIKILEWYVGTKTDFTATFGIGGKNMKKYITSELYDKILSTYSDGDTGHIWSSLFTMTDLFHNLAKEVSSSLEIQYNKQEANNVQEYLHWVHSLGQL